MDLADPALSNDRFQVAGAEPSAGHDGDLITGTLDQVREGLDSLEGGGPATRSQHAFDAQFDQGIEGFHWLMSLVERLVERDVERPGQSDERRGLFAIDGRLGSQNTEDDSGSPKRLGNFDVVPHDGDFRFRIDEVARPRPDQDMDRNVQPAARFGDCARAGGRSSHSQVVAQLDPIGAAGLGGDGRCDVPHADLDLYTSVYGPGSPKRLSRFSKNVV